MTTNLRSMIRAQIGWTWRDEIGNSTILDANRLQASHDLTDGTGSGQADVVWHAESQTLANGSTAQLQLDALEQTLFGETITLSLSAVKALLLVNRNTASGRLTIGPAADTPWTGPFGSSSDRVGVMPDSPLLLAHVTSGWTVQATENLLQLEAADADVTYDVAILGTSV